MGVLKSEVNSTLINVDEQLLNKINQTYIKVSGKFAYEVTVTAVHKRSSENAGFLRENGGVLK